MAAIDFPASPTTNQTFVAPNGITYIWNGTLWLAVPASGGVSVSDTPPLTPTANQLWFNSLLGSTFIYYNDGNTTQWVPATPNMNVPTSPGGDFFAYVPGSGGGPVVTNVVTIPKPPVISGNSGSWYNATTGVFTPPAGRYTITAVLSVAGGAAADIRMALTKNSVQVEIGIATAHLAGYVVNVAINATVDANGTDAFNLELVQTSGTATQPGYLSFSAFPISGVKGPPGDFGTGFRLLQRTVVASAVSSVQITSIASDINDLMFTFDIVPVTNAVDLYLRMYDNAGVISATGYTGASVLGQHNQTQGSAPSVNAWASIALTIGIPMNYSAAGNRVYNVHGIRGSGKIPNMRGPRSTVVNFQSAYTNDTSTNYDVITGSGQRDVSPSANGITGIQLVFNGSNIATGSTFSVWGSP